MAITEKNIRTRILDTIWEMFPESKKIRRNPLVGDRESWAGKLTPEANENSEDEKLPFAFIVRRTGYKAAGKSSTFDQFTFEILAFKGFDFGTDEQNSEDEFQNEVIDELVKKLKNQNADAPLFEFENENDRVAVEELNFSRIGLVDSSKKMHFGGGRYVVNIFRC